MAAKPLGQLHMFPTGERPIKTGLTFTSSWAEIDFTADLPAGTKAVLIAVDARNNDGKHIVCFSNSSTRTTPAASYHGGMLSQSATIGGYGREIQHVTVMVKSSGKFYVAVYDSSAWETYGATNIIEVLGYYADPEPATALTSGSDWDTSGFTYGVSGQLLAFNGEIITNAAVSAGDTIGTLPAGSRPDVPSIIDLMTKEGGVIKKVPVSVDTNGLMVLMANVGQTIHLTAWNILRKLG